MVSNSTWVKIALGLLAVVIVWAVLRMLRGKKKTHYYNHARLNAATPVPEKFVEFTPAGYDDDEEEEEDDEEFADYVPPSDEGAVEQFVDASDVYSPPEFSGQLLE